MVVYVTRFMLWTPNNSVIKKLWCILCKLTCTGVMSSIFFFTLTNPSVIFYQINIYQNRKITEKFYIKFRVMIN